MKLKQSEIAKAISDTLGDIEDILQKSGLPMRKPVEGSQSEKQSSTSDDSLGKADDQEDDDDLSKADPGELPPPESPADGLAPDMGDEGDGFEGEGESELEGGSQDEIAASAKELSDEELDMMLSILSAEKESRSAGDMGGDLPGDMPPEGALEPGQSDMPPEGAGVAPGDEADKARYKQEYLNLHKSIQSFSGTIQKLNDSVNALQKDVAGIKTARKKNVTKAPVARRDQEVLEKSSTVSKKVERLNKSQTEQFLMGKVKEGNPLVNRRVMLDLTYCQDDNELHQFQDKLITQGLQFPSLK